MEIKSETHKVGWESPSNIALIKYWGKHGRQLPNNPSMSFTLSKAATRTFISWTDFNKRGNIELDFTFEGKENPAFAARVENFLDSITDDYFPFLKDVALHIESSNSFPHSSGIASSASGMSALALCLCNMEGMITGEKITKEDFDHKVSVVSRLGSGSACRSVFPEMAVWGKHPDIKGSSDEFAIGIGKEINEVFKTFHDDILIISKHEKSVSSSAGHKLMTGNPFAPARYQQANERLILLYDAVREGDVDTFGKITEDEALSLHALMMCSDPPFILMEEGSLAVIKKIKAFRADTRIPVYFTLDAGPNVHVLYPEYYEQDVKIFIHEELKQHCHEGRIINDKVGQGALKLC